MKKKAVVVVFVMLGLVSIILGTVFTVYNSQSDKYTLENIYNAYMKADEMVVATVNDVNITNKELSLIQYSYGTSKPIDRAIEQQALNQLAEKDGFSLSQSEINKEVDYITERYKSLNLPDNAENRAFYNALVKEHLAMTTSIRYQYSVQKQIMHQNFYCDNQDINEKYEKYKTLYQEWEDGGKENTVLYDEIWSLREEITQEYIDHRISQFKIEKL